MKFIKLFVLVYQDIESSHSVIQPVYHVHLVYNTPFDLNYALPWQR